MSANKFVLKHHHIEVDCTIGITPGLPALVYKDGPNVKNFTAAEIITDKTGLGSLVSVSLVKSIDTGGERFGFFLPELDVPNREIHYGWRLRPVRWARLDPTPTALVELHRVARHGADRNSAARESHLSRSAQPKRRKGTQL